VNPPATTSRDQARTQLEQAADRLFYRNGVVGVTVAAIRDESGVSLRRIYEICPSKADLIALWLRHRHSTWTAEFTGEVGRAIAGGTAPIDAVFAALEAWMVETEFRGCGFINTHAETSELTDEHIEIIQEHKRGLAAFLDDVVGHGDAIAVLIDGAIVQASMFSSVEPIGQARATAAALISLD